MVTHKPSVLPFGAGGDAPAGVSLNSNEAHIMPKDVANKTHIPEMISNGPLGWMIRGCPQHTRRRCCYLRSKGESHFGYPFWQHIGKARARAKAEGRPTRAAAQKMDTAKKQLLYIHACLNPEITTKKERAIAARVSPSTIDNWERDPAFRELKAELLKKYLDDNCTIQELIAALKVAATRPGRENVYAIQMYLRLKDETFRKIFEGSDAKKISLSLTLNQDNRKFELTEERLKRIGTSLKEAEDVTVE